MPSSSLSTSARFLLTTFGLGHLRPAPGTWGSLPPVVLVGLLYAAHSPAWVVNLALAVILVLFSLACVIYGDAAEAHFNRKDPSSICADETAGQCLPLLFLPASMLLTPARLAVTLVGAFLLFRILDILKPWPARGLQKLPAGWGVLIDDLVVGLMALALVQAASLVM